MTFFILSTLFILLFSMTIMECHAVNRPTIVVSCRGANSGGQVAVWYGGVGCYIWSCQMLQNYSLEMPRKITTHIQDSNLVIVIGVQSDTVDLWGDKRWGMDTLVGRKNNNDIMTDNIKRKLGRIREAAILIRGHKLMFHTGNLSFGVHGLA